MHIKLSAAKDYGLPQNRSILTVVASPFCAKFPWHFASPDCELADSLSLETTIGDLGFANPPATGEIGVGLVCMPTSVDEIETDSPRYIFNHRTEERIQADHRSVSVSDDGMILDLSLGPKMWIHPSKSTHLIQAWNAFARI